MRTPNGLEKHVAVKLLSARFDPRGTALARLRNEAELLAGLRHPVVLAPLDGVYTEFDGRGALVTEFIEGQDLSECIDPLDPHRLPTSTLLEVVEQVSSALEAAWTQLRVVHRDVKPNNIRIGVHGNVKLLDFGVARTAQPGDDREPASLVGTLPYLAPECFNRDMERIPASDVFALGCVLYRGVTGQDFNNGALHFAQSQPAPEVWGAFLEERLALVTHEGVRLLLESALAHDPGARPSARVFAERCSAIIGTFPDHVRLAQWCRDRAWPEKARAPVTPSLDSLAPRPDPATHIPMHRLADPNPTEDELVHIASCFQCRSNRRALMKKQVMVGQYRLIGLIGRGGMSDVYQAVHSETGEQFAVKLLHSRQPGMDRRVAREARVQDLVDSPYVLPLVDTFEHEGSTVLVLPYIRGPSLSALLKAQRLPEPVAGALFAGIVSGLAALHARGAIHRDLKPANILLDPTDGSVTPRIADFGLAKVLEDDERFTTLTSTRAFLGTLPYAPPEQRHSSKHVDARADIYALGVIGTELFGTARGDQNLPEPWRSIVLSMLAEDPAGRPADAGVVQAKLPATTPIGADWSERCQRLTPVVQPIGPNPWDRRSESHPEVHAPTFPLSPASSPPSESRGGFLAGMVFSGGMAALALAGLVYWGVLQMSRDAPVRAHEVENVGPSGPPPPGGPGPVPPGPPSTSGQTGTPAAPGHTATQGAAAPPAAAGPAAETKPPSKTARAPDRGTLRVTGDSEGVSFVGPNGQRHDPGAVPPGTYTVEAYFPDYGLQRLFEVTVAAGQVREVRCSAAFTRCDLTK